MSSSTVHANNIVIGSVSGRVMKGNQIGRTIGFPTANLDLSNADTQLERGVYGVKVQYDHKEYIGMMSVGVRPTFHKGETSYHYEVHIFDFAKDIYGEKLVVDILFYIRDEVSFPSVEQLIEQIQKDQKETLKRFAIS
ncbi:riboflavin kinase [Bacillus dakarensis]|uniref:riboflavin kinase n=1 Tax=Robertmurraya dakarensis TaxID=1926278 RepID=UPI000980B2BE|nr:riboflavin kinase [Bacillus dakarensis]